MLVWCVGNGSRSHFIDICKMETDKMNNTKKAVEEKGASLVEYALLVALIAVVAITAVTVVGQKASQKFSTVGGQL